jgi:hypothetical protein
MYCLPFLCRLDCECVDNAEWIIVMSNKWVLIIVLGVLLAGCNAPGPVLQPTAEVHETLTLTTTTPKSGIPPSTPTEVRPSFACPVPLGAPAIPSLTSSSEWANTLLAYLNQGGSLSGLIEAMPDLDQSDPGGLGAVVADLNGDSLEDLAITLVERPCDTENSLPGESALLIYLCAEEQYRLTHAASSSPNADRLHLYRVTDLTGDGVQELLVMQEFCGAHTCFQAWEVLQWQRNRFVNILAGRSDDLSSPVLEIRGPRPDGSMILNITGSGVQSAGAGPSRTLTRTWHWSEAEMLFEIVEERLSEPTFRIHALHDADQAALHGDLNTALGGYSRVIEDPNLDDYPYAEEGRAQLSAYAIYRSMLLWILSGNLAQAETTLIFLQEAYPPGSPGGGFSALAGDVWLAYQAQPDMVRACQTAQAYALAHPGEVLDPLNYGYANKTYAPVDICPYTQ